MVIAHGHQDTAETAGSRHIGMAHHIARPVYARPLAIPEREDAIKAPLAPQLCLLGAPDSRGGQILVQARLEQDIGGLKRALRPRHRHVHIAKRRSAIARAIACRVQPCRPITRLLHQHQTHQSLSSVQQDRRFVQVISVRQRNALTDHILPAHRAPPLAKRTYVHIRSKLLTYKAGNLRHLGIYSRILVTM